MIRRPSLQSRNIVASIVFAFAVLTLGFADLAACYASAQQSVTVDGGSRTYFVYLPKSYSASQRVPVVFVLHPLKHDAGWAEQNMGWDKCADKNGFIVIYGQSGADNGVWNAGLTRSERASGADDVGYLQSVMDAVESSYTIDMSHVYMVGFSAGAFMTAKMGATIPKSLTAIATVEGMTGLADNDSLIPPSPLSAIMFRGTSDDVVPYTSDNPSSLFHVQVFPATGTASDWALADGCTSPPTTTQINGGGIVATDYKSGTGGAEVELMTVNGGKHEYRPEDTDLIWQFFSAQTKPTEKP